MKQRILTNWTFARVLYLGMGSLIIIQSVVEQQWLGVACFSAMGLFAFGCADGNCYGSSCATDVKNNTNFESTEVTFEEIKTKTP
jgi:hypothetical protein